MQWVKDPALSWLQLRSLSLLWCGYSPSPGNFHIPEVQPKRKKNLLKKSIYFWRWLESVGHYMKRHGKHTTAIIIFSVAIMIVVILLSKVIALVQAEQRCQACGRLASPETHVLYL